MKTIKHKGVTYNKYKDTLRYKGYGIYFINGEYRATAYANPQLSATNFKDIKRQINKYLSE